MSASFSAILHHKTTKEQTTATVSVGPGTLHIRSGAEIFQWIPADLTSSRLLPDGSVILQNGVLFLEVKDPAFAQVLERSFGNKRLFRRSFFDKIGLAGCLIAVLFFLLPLLAAYIWVVPGIADRAARKVSPETEKQIGDSWFTSLTAAYPVDSSCTRLVQTFYDSLQFGGDYQMQITVVKEPVVNAFAVPGGHIVVFDSIIGIMTAPEQLAGLLAHEASHVQLKHSTRAIFRELANNLFFSLLFGGQGDLSAIVAQHGSQLAGLSYSRELEMEADEHGLELMANSGIPQRGIPDLFRNMQASAGKNASVPTFLSTHPALEERIRITTERIARTKKTVDQVPEPLQQIWEQLKTNKNGAE